MKMKTSLQALAAQHQVVGVPEFSLAGTFAGAPGGAAFRGYSSDPSLEELDYHGQCEQGGAVSCDFFDFVPLKQRGLLVSVGDVSRHGIGAGILLSGLKAFLRSTSAHEHEELSELVGSLNRCICDLSPDNFHATLFSGLIDPVMCRLRYVSAGQEPALLFHPVDGRLRRLERTGTVLGLTARTQYQQHTIPLEPGDTLVAFTDGITEATDMAGREFREQGVRRVLEQYPEASARELSSRILEAVEAFRQCAHAADDRTVVVVRLLNAAAHPSVNRAEELAVAAA